MVRLSSAVGLHQKVPKYLAFWLPAGTKNWRVRLAITYAMSVWSMIGFVAFMNWRTKDKVVSPNTAGETSMDEEEDPSQSIKPRSTYSVTMEYKENSTPYTTRLYQYFTSSNKTSDSGSTEN